MNLLGVDVIPSLLTLPTIVVNILHTLNISSLLLQFLHSSSAIESPVNLLECGTPCLDEQEVYSNQLDEQPTLEEEVELPASGVDANGDDVLRYSETGVRRQVLQQQTVGANLEAENLKWVRHVEGNPGEVVEEVVEEDHRDDTLAPGLVVLVRKLLGGQGDPDGEGAAHAGRRDQEKWTTTEAVNHQSPEPSLEHIDHEDEAVEHVLVVW